MSHRVLTAAFLVIAATLVSTGTLQAAELVVGAATCGPKTARHYVTIQDAVNAANVLDTVAVCPGLYPEQVIINYPLIVKGISDGSSGTAVITVPPAGLISNTVLAVSGRVAAQVTVENTFGVQLWNLTIDGTGEGCATDVGADRTAGLVLNNLQSEDPSWINTGLYGLEVRNQQGGCGRASGILSENSLVEVNGSRIHDIEMDAVSYVGGTGVVTNDLIANCGFSAVLMSGVQNATISGDTMSGVRYGVHLESSVNINVWYNNMGPWLGYGIYTHNGSLSWIEGNSINATFFGIYLNGSMADRVTNNSIVQTESIGLVDMLSRGGNQIWTNTFDGAPVGIYIDANAVADDIEANEFSNVTTPISTTANPF